MAQLQRDVGMQLVSMASFESCAPMQNLPIFHGRLKELRVLSEKGHAQGQPTPMLVALCALRCALCAFPLMTSFVIKRR